MATEKQIDANRENAKKFTGTGDVSPCLSRQEPVARNASGQGKAIASQNSRPHNHLAQSILLASENGKRFCNHVARFHREFRPEGPTERTLVDMMAVARWRMLRMANLEAAGLGHEYRQLPNHPDSALDAPTRATRASRSLADTSRTLDLIGRAEARLRSQFDSAFGRLTRLRAEAARQFNPDHLVPPRPNPATNPIPAP